MRKAGMNESYFFDTYAFFEIIRGNPRYEVYKEAKFATTKFNLAELNYGLKKEMSEEQANNYIEEYWKSVVDIELEDIKEAMSLKNRFRDLSIPDCIGYIIAKRLGIKFLTGDEGFRNFENVEFVKK